MLNEKRVKHMVKLASYEGKDGAEEIKIYSYFRKDYVGYNVLISLLWITLGYLALIGMIGLALVERILENLSLHTGNASLWGGSCTFIYQETSAC